MKIDKLKQGYCKNMIQLNKCSLIIICPNTILILWKWPFLHRQSLSGSVFTPFSETAYHKDKTPPLHHKSPPLHQMRFRKLWHRLSISDSFPIANLHAQFPFFFHIMEKLCNAQMHYLELVTHCI